MLYKKLGNTDVEVSIVCLGTMTWGEQNTEEEAWEQLDYFVNVGGNFVDVAELYPGKSFFFPCPLPISPHLTKMFTTISHIMQFPQMPKLAAGLKNTLGVGLPPEATAARFSWLLK